MFDRLRDMTEEQLNVGIAISGALCVVMLFIMILLNATTAGATALNAVGLGDGATNAGEPTPTLGTTLPPTWTPRATNTATPTVTPRPTETETPTVEVTETTEITPTLEVESTPTPDYAATITAAQSSTPVAPPPPAIQPTSRPSTAPVAPAPAPVVPVIPPVAAPPVAPPVAPTERPAPTSTPAPSPTPLPLYVLAELLGGPNCQYSGISGTIRNNDGSPRAGTTVEVFNETGYKQTLTTDAAGFYEAFLDSKPREDLKGFWHIRILEGTVQGSNEIVVVMSGDCTSGETQFVANFYRSQ
ncbi:MAG: carboxypeptidase regulatory-like domain-containing protein [Ardenticatenales bacterium]|nr:carboxypeptidase regulatory-like domain-containing protein [Ardenticatenales bacterium]